VICKARLDSIAPFDSPSRFMMALSGLRKILEGMTAMKPLLFVVFVLFSRSRTRAHGRRGACGRRFVRGGHGVQLCCELEAEELQLPEPSARALC